jgi:hypothetical protein
MNGKPFGNNFRLLALVLCLVILTTVSAIAKKKPKKKTPATTSFNESLVYQEIPLAQFSSPAPDNLYFLSGWVCPGSGSAMLALVTYSGGGKVKDSAGVEIASSGEVTQIGFADDAGLAYSTRFEHPDFPGEDFRYYRIFAKIPFTAHPSIKEARIILQNTSNNLASCSVWFDGVKLEKAQNEIQEYPTSYHSRGNLLSPEFTETLEGGPSYYEW